MFVLNPDHYLLPSFRISPFSTKDISINHDLPVSDKIDNYFSERFNSENFIYTINGRQALNKALSYYQLKNDDIVTILTTSGNFYISSCVTNEIEKFCKWNRKITGKTKVILVNHEFGYPFKNLIDLKKHNLPIIEDCAHSFFSDDRDHSLGNIGDFVIYSFPKMFQVQIGGLLKININYKISKNLLIDKNYSQYIKNVLSHYIAYKEDIIEYRIKNYQTLAKKINELGYNERFKLEEGIVPGVFLFKTDKPGMNINLAELKEHFYNHGVQCSVFYGEEAFFLPVHQGIKNTDIDYFLYILNFFINGS